MVQVLEEPAVRLMPDPLYQLAMGFTFTRTLLAAHRLGLLEALSERDKSPDELATEKNFSRAATEMLLEACAALKLCAKSRGRYALTPIVKQFLLRESPTYLGHFFDHFNDHIYPAWSHLEEAVRTGQGQIHRVIGDPQDHFFQAIDRTPGDLETFMLTMEEHSVLEGDALAAAYNFSSHHQLLDVAGGTGAMSAAIVKRYPNVRAVVLERPSAAEVAQRILRGRGLSDRIQVQAGDMFKDPLPTGADVALLSGTLHNWGPPQAQAILLQCRQALMPGAKLLISEQVLDEAADSPIGPLCSLNMMVLMGGREYSKAEYVSMLSAADFELEEIRPTDSVRQLLIAKRR